MPALVILGLGMGAIFAPAIGTATLGVTGNETGVASAMVNTSQQVGGSVGTAALSTVFASATARYVVAHAHQPASPGSPRSMATRWRSGGARESSRSG